MSGLSLKLFNLNLVIQKGAENLEGATFLWRAKLALNACLVPSFNDRYCFKGFFPRCMLYLKNTAAYLMHAY